MAGAQLRIQDAVGDYLQELIRQRLSPERVARRVRRTAHDWDRLVQQVPRDLTAILESVRLGELDVPLRMDNLDRNVNRLVHGILAAALVSGARICGRATVASAVIAIRVFRASRRSGGVG